MVDNKYFKVWFIMHFMLSTSKLSPSFFAMIFKLEQFVRFFDTIPYQKARSFTGTASVVWRSTHTWLIEITLNSMQNKL